MAKAPNPKPRSQAKPQQKPKPGAKPKPQAKRSDAAGTGKPLRATAPGAKPKPAGTTTGKPQSKARPGAAEGDAARPKYKIRPGSNKPSQPAKSKTQPRQEEAEGTRLNKFISDTGHCSRREADKLIEQGRVKVNGKKAEMGTRVTAKDKVTLDGDPIGAEREETVYLAFNKPVGITCTTDTNIKDNIIDYISFGTRIFPIGRLDKPSEGLIFLTNDGDIVNKILRAGNQHEKEYIVTVDKPISAESVRRMSNGIPILDTVTQKCLVEQLNRYTFRIILTQGLNRQIRRMCEYLGYEVTRLIRTRIMNVNLDRLAPGHWRYLSKTEMQEINRMVADSSKTQEATGIRKGKGNTEDGWD